MIDIKHEYFILIFWSLSLWNSLLWNCISTIKTISKWMEFLRLDFVPSKGYLIKKMVYI